MVSVSGADIRDFAARETYDDFKEEIKELISPYDLIDAEKPIIGVAVGFGMSVRLNCDIIIVSEKASFGARLFQRILSMVNN